MSRRPALTMPVTKSSLSGNASPFVPNGLSHEKHSQLPYPQQPQQEQYPVELFLDLTSQALPPAVPASGGVSIGGTAAGGANSVQRNGRRQATFNLSEEWIRQVVSENNAFLLGQHLLTTYSNIDTYRREFSSGAVERIQHAMASAMRRHPDPTMFIINSLICVGTVAGFKNLDADFELAISDFLVAALQDFMTWYHEHPQDRKTALKEGSGAMGLTKPPKAQAGTGTESEEPEVLSSGFHFDEDFLLHAGPTTEIENDLIILEDKTPAPAPAPAPTTMAMTNNRPSAMMVQPKPVRAQNTGSSLLSLLDDDVGKPNLLQMAVLRPMVMDLIDLSDDNEQMDFVAPISSWTTTEPGTPGSSCDNSFRIINLDDDMMGDREDGAAMQVNLTQLKKANRILEEQNLHTDNSDCEGVRDVEDLNVSLIVFDSRVQNNKEDESLRNENDPKADKTSQDQKHQGADDENEEQGLVIQRRHLEKLLDEMVGGKNVLQVYASLDTLEMRSILMEPAKEGGGETYGWMLSRLLYEKKRFQESATVIFEYLQPSRGIPSVPNLSSTLNLTSSTSEGWAHPIAIRRYLGLNRLPSSTSSTISSSPSPSASPSKPTAASKTKAPVYQLPRETRIVFVNSSTQLPTLSAALRSSTRVGMDTEWLPHIQEYMGLRPATRTAILQLSCESDSTAYIVDTIAFKESTDRGAGLVQVIGEFLHDSKVVKIAYDWDGDRDLLEATFPLIHQQPYRPQSFMDLKYLWFRSLDGPTPSTPQEDKSQMASYLPSPVSSSSSTSSLSSSSTFSSSSSPTSLPSPALPLLKNGKGQWANYPAVQDMYQLTGGLSGMLTKLCGYRLNKTQQCSHWEQRPLTREQEIYAAVDAWCLLDIYAVLEKMEKLEKI